ncbi:MAG: glycosyltransferase family 2 protein [Limisphaerales bacterium]
MMFSVITPSFNCGDFILRNINSVRQQGFGPDQLEHWIIDGGSTDGTLDLLKNEKGILSVSEPDQGLSDAVNKGIQKAKGAWIIWLNADDFLAPNACKHFLDYKKKYPEIRIFAGDTTFLRYDGRVENTVEGWDYNWKELLEKRTGMNQASTFVHREVYEKVGGLDVSKRYAMDYEWLVRAMHHYKCVPIPHVLSFYQRRQGSITDVHMVKQFEEFLSLRRKYGRPYFSKAELYIRFYLYTNWLRRIRWLRRGIRRIKRFFGKEPGHPF